MVIIEGMKAVLKYLQSLEPSERDAFARRCGTSIGYLRKAASAGQKLGESLCIAIERESRRSVLCEQIRPDVDWAYLRGTAAVTGASEPKPAQAQAQAQVEQGA